MTEQKVDFMKLMRVLSHPKLGDIPYEHHPANEVIGVPQRAYGYVNHETKENQGIDKLQTTNVRSCVALTGHNEQGAFLTHLDSLVADQSPKMMDDISKLLGNKFHFNIFTTPSYLNLPKDDESTQEYLPRLLKILDPYAINLKEHQKGQFFELRIGITKEGKLFHPEENVENDALYGDEYELFRTGLSDGDFRTSLGCINHMEKKKYVPSRIGSSEIKKDEFVVAMLSEDPCIMYSSMNEGIVTGINYGKINPSSKVPLDGRGNHYKRALAKGFMKPKGKLLYIDEGRHLLVPGSFNQGLFDNVRKLKWETHCPLDFNDAVEEFSRNGYKILK